MTQALLNPHQLQAANHVEGPLLVLAGAGSGKTRIVTHRIAYLLELGVPASEILAVTFTNKAAEEMRSRVKHLSDQAVLTCTFHSLGARILRESIRHIGFGNDFTIYDEEDSRMLIKHCLKALNVKEDKGTVKSLKIAISNAKNDLLSPSDCDEVQLFEDNPQLFLSVYSTYQEKLKEYNALDFDDLLFLTVKLFKTCPEILAKYQKRWSFVLIDEYQDTNFAQYSITNLLVQKHQNLFVVGDPDQSIYSWRGANIQNILSFEKDYPGAKIITLEQNYRSTNHILLGANGLIHENSNRMDKNLWSELGDGEKIGICISESDREETHFVINTLLKHHENDHIPLDDIVIFYRTNSQSRIFEDALLRNRIPYVIIGGLSFYQRREIKDLLAIVRMVVSDSDFLSFARTINVPKRGIGPTTLAKLRKIAEEKGVSIMGLAAQIVNKEVKVSEKQRQGFAQYLDAINALREMHVQKFSIKDIFSEALTRFRYLEYLKEDPESFEDRRENLEQLISKAAEWELENSGLSAFLEELTLQSAHEESDSDACVKLMTLHNGKGLEFTLAFLVGMEEDLFPHANTKDTIEGLEEERRLCYVGMTRAKRLLYLTASKYRFLWGTPRVMQPSRFISEVPRENAYMIGEQPDTFDESSDEDEFHIGARVFHKDFGKGIVQKSYETSFGLTYDVLFPETGVTRTLVARYAKLTSS